MRILICAQDAPIGPINGFRAQVASVADALGATHDIRIVALTWPDQGLLPGTPEMRLVPAVPRTQLPQRLTRYPLPPWAAPVWCEALAELLGAAVREEVRGYAPDLVYVAGFRIAALWREIPDLPRLVAPLDAAHLSFDAAALAARGPARLRVRAAARWVRRFEAAEYARFDRVLVLSDGDRDALRAVAPGLKLEVVPHEVDPIAFAPAANSARDNLRIVFGGVMSAAANVTAAEFLARRVMPVVRESIADAHLVIVGRTPPRRIWALDRLDGVRVVGEVKDMGAWLAGSRACAAPMLSGSGVKNKLLEGMASGLPCVVTPLALGGLHVKPGRELLVGTTASELAGQLVRVLRDDGLATALGAAARAYVLAEHGRPTIARALGRICDEVVAQHRSAVHEPRVQR